jgi:tetratricopeptide (TPR) repeat protein
VRRYQNFVFIVLIAFQSNFLLAQTADQEASASNESLLLSFEQSDEGVANNNTMLWPVLPGESVADLAALFYPKNKIMQQRFTVKTLQLSHKIHPSLNATSTSDQSNLIIIPNIRSLAKHSDRIKHAPLKNKISNYRLKPILRENYDLQNDAKFAVLKSELLSIMDRALAMVEAKNKLIKQSKELHTQNKLPADTLTKNHTTEATQAVAPIFTPIKATPPRAQAPESILWYLWASILLLVLALSIFLGLCVFRKMKSFNSATAVKSKAAKKPAMTKNDTSAEQPVIEESAIVTSVAQEEFSGSMPGLESAHIVDLKKKEEIELALEKAKIYINLNRLKEAIALLRTQIQETPKATLHLWFCLLNIYRDSNQKEDFLENAQHLHENFNVMMPQWEATLAPIEVATSLDEFPHIIEKLTKLWLAEGKVSDDMPETKAYLDQLLMDNRSTERIGFGTEVFQEIMLLRDILDARSKLALDD